MLSSATALTGVLLGFQATGAAAQALVDMRYSWPYAGPQRVDTTTGSRGPMQGYNVCNSTTAGPQSHCVNTIGASVRSACYR